MNPPASVRLGRGASALIATTLAASLLSACSTQTPTQFHSLLMPPSAVDAPPADPRATANATPLLYDFGPVSIPPQADQPQFVIRNPDDSLTMLEQQRWISPLADELHGALAERLGRRYKAQQARLTAPDQRATERLRVDVVRFESLPGHEVRLEALWTVRTLTEPGTGVRCHSEIRQSIGTGYEAIAAGHRAALTLLADEIGPVMQALQTGQATCR